MKLQADLEVRSRNILLAPELWKGSLHQTTSNRLYNKQLFFLESLLALWRHQTFSEPVRSIPSALGKVTPLLKSLLETSKKRSDGLRNIENMELRKLHKYNLSLFAPMQNCAMDNNSPVLLSRMPVCHEKNKPKDCSK